MIKPLRLSLSQIPAVSQALAKQLRGGEILALVGPLGAGKTTFTQNLARHLKIKHRVTSPTFTLMHVFPFTLDGKPCQLIHLDLYRTKNFTEVKALGLAEFWGRPDTVTVIEWADKIKRHLPKSARVFRFENQHEKILPT